jgi:hypothetical protein
MQGMRAQDKSLGRRLLRQAEWPQRTGGKALQGLPGHEMKQKSIRERLENWATWSRWSGSRGADCMTGAICERMRKAALGNLLSGADRPQLDEDDALRVELAWRIQTPKNRDLLLWTYINNARPEVICRKLKIPARPVSAFIEAFRAAEDAIEKTLDLKQHGDKIPSNNLIPSNKTSDFTQGIASPVANESLD